MSCELQLTVLVINAVISAIQEVQRHALTYKHEYTLWRQIVLAGVFHGVTFNNGFIFIRTCLSGREGLLSTEIKILEAKIFSRRKVGLFVRLKMEHKSISISTYRTRYSWPIELLNVKGRRIQSCDSNSNLHNLQLYHKPRLPSPFQSWQAFLLIRWFMQHCFGNETTSVKTFGPFIREKIRRDLKRTRTVPFIRLRPLYDSSKSTALHSILVQSWSMIYNFNFFIWYCHNCTRHYLKGGF